MKFFAFLTLSVLSFTSLIAQDYLLAPVVHIQNPHQYFGIIGGTNHCELTKESNHGMKVGVNAGVKYGYIFGNGFRVEGEVAYRHNSFSTKYNVANLDILESKEYNHKHSWSYMANGFFDLANLQVGSIIPYVGAGIGYCQNTEKKKMKFADITNEEKTKDNRFAYQGIIGAKYQINADYSAGLEYHYFVGKSHAKEHSVGMIIARNF
jgi:opacity protein-like surface antigen